jgi:catechol 2,3-dioxygenase-like lactoylglutathione lyase family enzyme
LTAPTAIRDATAESNGRTRRADPRESPQHPPAESAWKPLSLFHFTLSVRSLERSIAFYEALGFRVLRDNRDVVWPDYVAAQFGLDRAQGRGALLALGDEALHTRLDLIQWLEPEAAFPDTPPETTAPRILAIRTENVRAAYEALRVRGIAFVTPPRGPDVPTGIEAVVCCRDPDGTLVELIEYMPGVLGSRIDALERRSE